MYLMLCNQLLHDVFPTVTTIGEDVSGMPTFCRCAPTHAILRATCRSWQRPRKLLLSLHTSHGLRCRAWHVIVGRVHA